MKNKEIIDKLIEANKNYNSEKESEFSDEEFDSLETYLGVDINYKSEINNERKK